MIKPTVGRIVWVYRSMSNTPEAAIICHVWNDSLINVAGFTAQGAPFAMTSVQLLQDDDIPWGQHWAEWMPYQQGQAAKTEKLETELSALKGKSE